MERIRDRPTTVLHVDDEPVFGNLVSNFLKREAERFNVKTTTRASDALDRLAETGVDCVVSDYEMPGKDGIEFLQTVREDHPDLPFLLYTGKGSEEVASEAISKGVTDYIQKGMGTEQYTVLANRIINAVEKYRAERLVNRASRELDNVHEGIALLDENGEFIFVNDAYTDIVGYDTAELIGECWENVYTDDQVERIYEEILPAGPEKGYSSGDTMYRRKDGSRILVNYAHAYSEEWTLIHLRRDFSDDEPLEQVLKAER